MRLHLATDFAFPLELVTESVAILARRRAGKSNAAKVLVEQLFAAKQQVVVIDPKGDWWGLRSSRDGKGPGLPIIILGGEHADVPLEVGAGELVARLVVQDQASVVLDTSKFRKHERATFMAAFLEVAYNLKAQDRYRTPMMLVIDEADQIAPQKPMHGEERMLGAADDIVRLGGQRGLGALLISQRAAVLNKNVLTQTAILILLQTTGSQDLDAVDAWIEKHGQPEERAKVMAALPALPRGTAWVWAPGWPDERGIFRQVAVNLCETFDSGATPKPGERRIVPKTVADVDLEAFRREMAATIEKAKAEDPRILRAEISRLKGELAKVHRATTTAPAAVKRLEVPVLKAELVKRLESAATRLGSAGSRLEEVGKEIGQAALQAAADLQMELKAASDWAMRASSAAVAQTVERRALTPVVAGSTPARRATPTQAASGDLTGPEQRIIDTVTVLGIRGITVTRPAVARWLGIHPNGSRYLKSLASLRARRLLDGWSLTAAGAALALWQRTGEAAAFEALKDNGARTVLRAVINAGRPLTREQLAAALNIHPNGSRFLKNLAWLRAMGLITERGPIQATEALTR